MGYTRSVISGFSWQTGLKLATSGLSLIKVAILARLLSPNDFGLFSLALVALGLTEALTQTGINITIIQSEKPTKYFVHTAWVIAIGRGLAIGLIMALMAFALSTIYQKPTLLSLTLWAALIPVVKGFINPYIINWYKNLNYQKETIYYVSLAIFEALLAILCAYFVGSAFALVWSLLITALLEVVISFSFLQIKPKFAFSGEVGKLIWQNAKGLTLSSALTYINDNVDDLIVGKTLGTAGLGLYHNGYALGHKLNYDLSKGAFHSLLPVFSRVKDDATRMQRGFDRSLLVVAGLTFILTLPVILIPEFVVKLVLGTEWLAIVPVAPWLGLAGWVHALESVVYSGWVATKKYSLLNMHLVVSILLVIPFMWQFSLWWGLMGAGIGLLMGRLVAVPLIGYGIYQLRRGQSAQT